MKKLPKLPVIEQIKTIERLFSLDPEPALEYSLYLSDEQDYFAIPKITNSVRYLEALSLVFEKIKSINPNFHDHTDGIVFTKLETPKQFALDFIFSRQKGEIAVIPIEFKYNNKNADYVLRKLKKDQYPLGILEISLIFLNYYANHLNPDIWVYDVSNFITVSGEQKRSPCFFGFENPNFATIHPASALMELYVPISTI